MKGLLWARIQEIQDETLRGEGQFYRPLAAFDDTFDQLVCFREMEALEVQELVLRFSVHPGFVVTSPAPLHAKARDADRHASNTEREDDDEPDDAAEDIADDELDELGDFSGERTQGDEDRKVLAWLQQLTAHSTAVAPSNEFVRWALEERERQGVSRWAAVSALLQMRQGTEPSAATRDALQRMVTDWARLESLLIEHNSAGARYMANRYQHHLPRALAFASALVGLRRAVLAFEPRRGFQFLTYAGWWMRHQVTRSRIDSGTAIRVPVHIYEKLGVLKRSLAGMQLSSIHLLTSEQMLAAIKAETEKLWSVEELDRVRAWDRRQWFSDMRDPAESVPLIDRLFDDSRWSPSEVALSDGSGTLAESYDALIGAIENYIVTVKASDRRRTREIVYARLGLDGRLQQPTLKQLGDKYGVSRERIRQIEEKALLAVAKKLELAGKRDA